jgi:hypothetical protein
VSGELAQNGKNSIYAKKMTSEKEATILAKIRTEHHLNMSLDH